MTAWLITIGSEAVIAGLALLIKFAKLLHYEDDTAFGLYKKKKTEKLLLICYLSQLICVDASSLLHNNCQVKSDRFQLCW